MAHPTRTRPGYRCRKSSIAVAGGYGILQPRVGVSVHERRPLAAWRSLYAGETGVDMQYHAPMSDAYQDLFGEGIFAGKGLVRRGRGAPRRSTGAVPRKCAAQSHDLFEGAARAAPRLGSATSSWWTKTHPARWHSALQSPQHRRLRGDWQITVAGCCRGCPGTQSGRQGSRIGIPLVSQLEDSGQPAPQPGGAGAAGDARRRLDHSAGLPCLLDDGPWWQSWRGRSCYRWSRNTGRTAQAQIFPRVWRNLRADSATALAQVILGVTFLASRAVDTAHAIVLTLVQVVAITSRRLLDGNGGPSRPRGRRALLADAFWAFRRRDGHQDVVAAVVALFVQQLHPAALQSALRFLMLSVVTPALAYWLSLPVGPRVRPLTDRDRRLLRRTARKTWRSTRRWSPKRTSSFPPDNSSKATTRSHPPDVADQHRHGAAVDARRPRSRLPRRLIRWLGRYVRRLRP